MSFNPNQPRVPAGSPAGGQFAGEAAAHSSRAQELRRMATDPRRDTMAAISLARGASAHEDAAKMALANNAAGYKEAAAKALRVDGAYKMSPAVKPSIASKALSTPISGMSQKQFKAALEKTTPANGGVWGRAVNRAGTHIVKVFIPTKP